jgi:hypothetical protein
MTERKAQLTLGIKTEGASKAAAEVERIAQEFAGIAKTSGSVGSSLRLAVAELQKFGATEDDVRRLTKSFNEYRKTVEQAADETRELGAEQAKVTTNVPGAPGGGGVSLSSRLSRIGSEARALPSQRIQLPGGGDIGTDAIANFIRLGGAVAGVGEKAAETSKVAQFLTPILGQTAAGITSMAVAALPYAVVFGAAALAVKSLTDEVSKQAEVIKKTVDAQRKGNQEILEGLTSDEARAKIEKLNQARQLEQDVLDRTSSAYQSFEQQAQAAVNSGENLAGALTDVIFGQGATVAGTKAVNAAEDELYQSRETSVANLAKIDAETADYNALLASGALAVNDAADALERLSQTTLGQADAAAKELAAKQRADAADGAANTKRLEAIEDETAQVQASIDVLTASGLTTSDVTEKIASLKDQLGLLGKESEYISGTALAAAKARDTEKKAAEDNKKALEDAARAQEQQAKAIQSANTTYKNSVQDIGSRLRYTLIDNAEKTNRDLLTLQKKLDRDEYDLSLKSYRSERDSALDQADDLDKIRRSAAKSEQEALIEGNFKNLYLARVAGQEALTEDQKEYETEKARRALTQAEALQDLRRNNERQTADRRLGYAQQTIDARTAQQRELQQASLTRNRALAVQAEGQNAGLKQIASYWQQFNAIQAQGISNALKLTGASTQGASNRSPFGAAPRSFSATLARVIG